MKKNVLVFPCGSEIALEVYRSLDKSTHFNLIGASSIADHGRFVFENYIEEIPFVHEEKFIPVLKAIVEQYQIDYLYPAMDSVIAKLKENEKVLGCYVVGSPVETTRICLSKKKTYEVLKASVRVPQIFSFGKALPFPVFCKPEVGYGSRGASKIANFNELKDHFLTYPTSLILEYLPGDEYTVDCFTNKDGELLYYGPRKRNRVSNGISVNTFPVDDISSEFGLIVEKLNEVLSFRGAWFVQLKRDSQGELRLLEIASRLGGSSSLFRARGINFAQLSLFDAMGMDVAIIDNEYDIEMDRALNNKYKLGISYKEVFIDYDDTLILDGKFYNTKALVFLYQCKNEGKKITLLSSHEGNLNGQLDHFGLKHLFDKVIHIEKSESKADFVSSENAIFIDDSFAERKGVADKGIPVFSIDMIEALVK